MARPQYDHLWALALGSVQRPDEFLALRPPDRSGHGVPFGLNGENM